MNDNGGMAGLELAILFIVFLMGLIIGVAIGVDVCQ